MATIVATDSGIEFGLLPLAFRSDGHQFLVPTSVRNSKERSAYNREAARKLFIRILEREDVTESNITPLVAELEQDLDQQLRNVCSQHMHRRKQEGCSASDEPKYLERAKRDILLFRAASETVEGESQALVSGLTRRYFDAAGIPCIADVDIKDQWQRTDLYEEVKKFDRKDLFVNGCLPPLLFFGGPFLLIGLVQLLWFIISPAVEAVTGFVKDNTEVWRVAVVLWVIGVGLYFVRSRFRLFYGVAETMFGVIISYMSFPWESPDYTLARWLSFLAALYVMVRGLDNIGKSLRHPFAVRVWTWLFGENYK